MSHTTRAAMIVQVVVMLVGFASPLWVKATGTEVYLETEKMDPRALFRGDFVILGYRLAQGILPSDMALEAMRSGRAVYVTITIERPARFVAVGLERPTPGPGQACLVGRARFVGSTAVAVDFPQIAQLFVAEGTGRALESQRGENLLARVVLSSRCNAVLLGLEPR